MKCLPTFEIPCAGAGSWNALTSPSKSDRFVCMPGGTEFVRQVLGHERGVHADIRRHLLHDLYGTSLTLSAIFAASCSHVDPRADAGASSWQLYSTGMPMPRAG